MTFVKAIQETSVETTTTNGMKALVSTSNPLTDLFFKIGASRGKDIIPDFIRAINYDAVLATKIALWARDVRGGAGERKIFRDILQYMEKYHPTMLELLMPHVSEYGRWDDLLIFQTSQFKGQAFNLIKDAIDSNNGLVAKWLPREKSSKSSIAKELRLHLKLSPKQYRKMLVSMTNVVETPMCANLWNTIEFGKVPSVAAARYQKAFNKHAPEEYSAYKAGLVSGSEKINAAAVYPYDVVRCLNNGDEQVALAQWEALPNYMTDAAVLPMVDVSGSMDCPVGGNKTLSCMDVAISLGLYCSDKNKGAFKDAFLTFSNAPQLEVLRGDLVAKYQQLNNADWGMNTNLNAAFNTILKVAVKNNIPEADMPKILLILSDMQFDSSVKHWKESSIEMIRRKYEDAGYEMPTIVYWNLNAQSNVPVRYDEKGTCLVSGFSPAIMQSILAAKSMTPYDIMMDTIGSPRYDIKL